MAATSRIASEVRKNKSASAYVGLAYIKAGLHALPPPVTLEPFPADHGPPAQQDVRPFSGPNIPSTRKGDPGPVKPRAFVDFTLSPHGLGDRVPRRLPRFRRS